MNYLILILATWIVSSCRTPSEGSANVQDHSSSRGRDTYGNERVKSIPTATKLAEEFARANITSEMIPGNNSPEGIRAVRLYVGDSYIITMQVMYNQTMACRIAVRVGRKALDKTLEFGDTSMCERNAPVSSGKRTFKDAMELAINEASRSAFKKDIKGDSSIAVTNMNISEPSDAGPDDQYFQFTFTKDNPDPELDCMVFVRVKENPKGAAELISNSCNRGQIPADSDTP
jgi:hypothetical protein